MRILLSLLLLATVCGCQNRVDPESDNVVVAVDASERDSIDALRADLTRYESECRTDMPRSDGCRGLAATLSLVGGLLNRIHEHDSAKTALLHALNLFDGIQPRMDSSFQEFTAWATTHLELTRLNSDSYDSAQAHWSKAHEMALALRRAKPLDSTSIDLLSRVYTVRAEGISKLVGPGQVVEDFQESALLLDSLFQSHPGSKDLAERRLALWESVAEQWGKLDRKPQARVAFQRAFQSAREFGKLDANNQKAIASTVRSFERLTREQSEIDSGNYPQAEVLEYAKLAQRLFKGDTSSENADLLFEAKARAAETNCATGKKDEGEKILLELVQLPESGDSRSTGLTIRARLFSRLSKCVSSAQKKVAYSREEVKALSSQGLGRPGIELVDALGELSWNALLAEQFWLVDSAVQAGLMVAQEQGLSEDLGWMMLNQAHAQVLRGKLQDALPLYRDLAPKEFPSDASKTYAWFIEDDLKQLEKAGFKHADFAKVRAILKKR
ncbi:MAG: hypothetical protein IPK50_12025 [Fibrobacterota bacterium]|nr:MAG: hypothetical protein IPK50_12025 [Fibrobacterota bacterium]